MTGHVEEEPSDAPYRDGDTGTFDTASIVKVEILAVLLWQHQEDGTTLRSSEQALATAMIEQSDNTAATTLFEAVGGESGLQEFGDMVGLSSTDVGSGGSRGSRRRPPTTRSPCSGRCSVTTRS